MSQYKHSVRNIDHIDTGSKIALVVADFNAQYTHRMEEISRNFIEEQGIEDIDTYHVPGAFELPGFTARLLEADRYDLIIVLGVVIRGDTPHFDYVSGESARGMMDLSIMYDTPVINGILTLNTEDQVEPRINTQYAIAGLNLLAETYKIEE